MNLFYTTVLSEPNAPKCTRLLKLMEIVNTKETKEELNPCKIMLRLATSPLTT